jgi:outer membrane protein insertion porin family
MALTEHMPAYAEDVDEAMAYKGWKVSGLEVSGLDRRAASRLSGGLYLSTKPALYPQVLEDDIARAMLFLARHGYPYASVSSRFSPNEARKYVKVILEIDTGSPVIVNRVDVVGMPEDLYASARRLVLTKPGSVLEDAAIANTATSLDSLLLYWGYARAGVRAEVKAIDTTSVGVIFNADAGRVNYFRDVRIENAPEDLVQLTEKVSDIKKGRRYSPKAVDDARNNLRRLDLYRRIVFDPAEVGEDSLDLNIRVATRDPRTVKASVRYWNDEGFRLGLSWRHRNLLRHGRGFYAAALASMILQRVELSLWWPALLAPRSREAMSLVAERQNEEAYEQVGYGIDLSTAYFFTIDNNILISLLVADVAVTYKTTDPVELDVPAGLMTVLSGRLNQNSTDDPFNPRRGFSSWTELKWAPERVSDNAFIKWEGSASTYLGQIDPAIFALRLALGAGWPTRESTAIIAGERFYSGGANSMRGFNRRKLGPKDSAGAPLGGEAKVEASLEVRGPLLWRIWGTAFVDAGQVWNTTSEVDLREIEIAIGPGLWLMTPVGPLRFDVGYRLTFFDPTEPRWVYHLSVGPAF